MDKVTFEDFSKIDFRVGTIISVEPFTKAIKPAYKLKIDFGDHGVKWSSAQITNNYSVEDLHGKQIVAAMNIGSKNIGTFKSEVLVMGVDDNNGNVRLLDIDNRIKNGAKVN